MRKKDRALESKRVSRIVSALRENPGGLWMREIARRTSMHPETARRLVVAHPELFAEYADFTRYGVNLKIVKLKPKPPAQ